MNFAGGDHSALPAWLSFDQDELEGMSGMTQTTDPDAGRGAGMGLGVFIAKTLLERTGAELTFENARLPDSGAHILIEWQRGEIEPQQNWFDADRSS